VIFSKSVHSAVSELETSPPLTATFPNFKHSTPTLGEREHYVSNVCVSNLDRYIYKPALSSLRRLGNTLYVASTSSVYWRKTALPNSTRHLKVSPYLRKPSPRTNSSAILSTLSGGWWKEAIARFGTHERQHPQKSINYLSTVWWSLFGEILNSFEQIFISFETRCLYAEMKLQAVVRLRMKVCHSKTLLHYCSSPIARIFLDSLRRCVGFIRMRFISFSS